jgi:hypothetical protein
MAARPDAEGAVVDLARLLLGERDEVLHGLHRQRRVDDQRMVDGDEAGDRREALDRIIRQLGVEARIDHEGHLRPDQQRVAVGRGLGDVFRRNLVVGAGLVLDDHLLAPSLGEALRQRASERIGHAAGRRRNDDCYRFGRIVGCLRGRHRRDQETHQRRRKPRPHSSLLLDFV